MAHVRRRLYLVRHAAAGRRGPAWPDDRLRPLTPDGRRRFRRVVRGIAAHGARIDLVLTSPLVRARQTADLLAAAFGAPRAVVLPALAPGGTPARVVAALARRRSAARRIALVGHEPDLGSLAAWLIGAREPLAFKKGGVCRIDVPWPPRQNGRLVWFATPGMLRRLRA